MNKKNIAHFRRQFKPDNEALKIHDMLSVYVMKESSEIFHYQTQPFGMLEQEQQELFMNGFKKSLGGQLDEKLFELKFQRDVQDSSQLILHQALLSTDTEEWTNNMLRITEKILKTKEYEKDIVITFIRGEYFKSVKSQNEESEENERSPVYTHPFILCSINVTQDPKKELLFDYTQREFKYNIVVDPIINLNAPISGFLFPCFTNNAADVNHVLYAAGKANEPDYQFIEEVLNGEETITAAEDKIIFEEVVRNVTGDKVNTETLSRVYEEIHHIVEENKEAEEAPRLDYKDVERVLSSSGVKDINTEKVEAAFQTVVNDNRYEIKAKNIVPKYASKSIKIETKVANISISPQDLSYVKQINFYGKKYLMIEVDEDTVVDGFTMIPEALDGSTGE
ncbi:DUF4317 domain-containing protein [Evansella clarkii]|uniref:DUF4317 domain-containing protein n=1 Tax=Evansella clarkii TaxID=79879 RepID=UPI00099874B1|nr:DUF4317 domain-containing protein [Evansella clarkii]